LRGYEYRRPVLFVHALLPWEQLQQLLARLADRFPGLTLFVLAGDCARSQDDDEALGVVVVEPPLSEAAAQEAGFYRGELEFFTRMPHGGQRRSPRRNGVRLLGRRGPAPACRAGSARHRPAPAPARGTRRREVVPGRLHRPPAGLAVLRAHRDRANRGDGPAL